MFAPGEWIALGGVLVGLVINIVTMRRAFRRDTVADDRQAVEALRTELRDARNEIAGLRAELKEARDVVREMREDLDRSQRDCRALQAELTRMLQERERRPNARR